MRVGLVIYGTLDTVSGGYLYDRKLVEYLGNAGDRVEVISIPWRNYAQHLFDNFSPSIYRRLYDLKVDVLLQDELNHPSLFSLNRKLHRHARYPIFSIVHHLRSYESHPFWLNLLYRFIERQYLASVDGFILNSETTRSAVGQVLGRRDLPNSIIAHPAGDRFAPSLTDAEIIARAHEPGALRIVFVGNLIRRKGLHVLMNALVRLPSDTWELTVVGNPNVDAKYARALRKQIAEQQSSQVRLIGAIHDDALANVLRSSQVLVVPSDYEGFGIVYLEGMSFGLPAIATSRGAAHEIIEDGKNGFLTTPNDVATLTDRIEELVRDRERLARMGTAARSRFLIQPGWEDSMAQIRTKLIEWMIHSSIQKSDKVTVKETT